MFESVYIIVDMNRNTNDLDFLLKIGFTLNEAKVYVTLIQNKAMNGYEIAKLSGVSRSIVYDVINRLVEKGFVIKSDGLTNYYHALDYEKVLKLIEEEKTNNLKIAESRLKLISKKVQDSEFIFNIKGFAKSIEKAKELIQTAKNEISLSIWEKEFVLIYDDLVAAIARGVKVYIFAFEDISITGAKIFSYRIKDAENLFPYRRILLIVDENEVIIGENCGEDSISIHTKNHALTSLATDEIVLNIFWYQLIETENLLNGCKDSKGFIQVLDKLREKMKISEDMTKNFMVYNYQYGGEKNGS